jgi:signal transduction histidine kinase/ActR/RegA family two-component response regulator
MNELSMNELEKERLGLLYRIGLSDSARGETAPEEPESGDTGILSHLLGDSLQGWAQGLAPVAPAAVLELLQGSETTKIELVQSDVEVLREVIETCEDVSLEGAFGLHTAAFPLLIGDRLAYVSWVRSYRTQPFTDDECEEIANATGKPLTEIKAAADLTQVLNPLQEERLLDLARETRDAIDVAVEQHLKARALAQQLVQSERTRALGSLSSGIAHRFNNLLSVILGYSSFLLNREEVSNPAAGSLRKISDAAQQGRRLTEEILAFAGSEVEEEANCHVHTMLNSILSLLQSQTSSRIGVETKFEAETDEVTAPPSAIHQLVFNLLTSAMDSMPGGGTLRVASTNRGDIKDEEDVEYLCLSITDSNGGLAAEAGEPMEESLQERESDQKINQAHGIAGSLDGTVTVSADPDAGTRVEVILPLSRNKPPEPTEVERTQQIGASRIWVVDDDKIFLQMCRQVLSDSGHTVELMESGREIHERWESTEQKPDLMIIDFSMPEYNGLEICQWLKDHGSTVPVILVSGFSIAQPDIHRALQFRKTYFLRKPFSFREIIDTATVALGETLIGEPSASP